MVLCLTTGCQKIKYKDDFRAPFLGRYQCTVEVFNQTLRCQDHELIHKEKINMTIQIVGDSFIAIKPYSLTYDEKKIPYDTLRYKGKSATTVGKPYFIFDNYNLNPYAEDRYCTVLTNHDSFSCIIIEGCTYTYYINGKKQ